MDYIKQERDAARGCLQDLIPKNNRLHWENSQLKKINQKLKDANKGLMGANMRVTTDQKQQIEELQEQVGRLWEEKDDLERHNRAVRVELGRLIMGGELRRNEALLASLQAWILRQLGGTEGGRTDAETLRDIRIRNWLRRQLGRERVSESWSVTSSEDSDNPYVPRDWPDNNWNIMERSVDDILRWMVNGDGSESSDGDHDDSDGGND